MSTSPDSSLSRLDIEAIVQDTVLNRDGGNMSWTLAKLIKRALEEPTLLEALSFASIWDTERAVAQAKRNDFDNWETTSLLLFRKVEEAWKKRLHEQAAAQDTNFKFNRFDRVLHEKTGGIYVIIGLPDTYRLVDGRLPAYAYTAALRYGESTDSTIYLRSRVEMEDGRFIKLEDVAKASTENQS